jgi:hypothetical protein
MRRAIVVAAFVAAFVAGGTSARACSCLEMDRGARIADTPVVFAGVPLASQPAAVQRGFGPELEWTFRIDAVTKGALRDRVVVRSWNNPGLCGMTFVIGLRYEVFAEPGADKVLETDLCSGTSEIAAGDPIPGHRPGTTESIAIPLVAGALAGISMVGVLLVTLRRRDAGGRPPHPADRGSA